MNEGEQHTTTPQVQIIQEQFELPQLGTTRRIWLYLPKDYEVTDLRYPVIYMQDGQNLFDAATASYAEWGIDEFMEQLPPEQHAIIVGIDHADADRIFEYNPYDTEDGQGKGKAYAAFLVETLKPFVDFHYRTLADPGNTIIAGSSLGGLIAMYTALQYPQTFGQAGIFSPAFWIAKDLYNFAASCEVNGSRFYFACGDAESESMVGDVQGMADIVAAKADVEVIIVPGGEHNEEQWQRDFPGFYNWLFKR